MAIRFEPTTFTASEVAARIGMDEAQQRNLRRHEYLKKPGPGWTRSSVVAGLSEILIFQVLSEAGVPPATIKPIANAATGRITLWAQQVPGAVSDPKGLAGGELPIKYPPRQLKRFLVCTPAVADLFDDLSKFYDRPAYTAGQKATAIVLDLKSLGELLVERAGPLWTVTEVEG